MTDREKVIKSLECCFNTYSCKNGCIYWNNESLPKGIYCRNALVIEAMELLKKEPEIIHCRDCAYFETEQRELVAQIFLFKNICKRWGEGCATLPDGFCFLGKEKEAEEKEQKRHDRD